jgi:hypothetical protein
MKWIFILSIVSIKLFIAVGYFISRLSDGYFDPLTIASAAIIVIVFAFVNLYLSYQALFYWCDLNALTKAIAVIGMFPLFYIVIIFLSIASISYYFYNSIFDRVRA